MNNEFIPALHGLRAVAALIVLTFHASDVGMVHRIFGGQMADTGVALFFTLSGFLMAHLYLGGPASGSAIRRYAVSRFARVYPLFAAVVLISGVTTQIGFGLPYPMGWRDVGVALLLISDAPILWTISVEFQFYAVFLGIWALYQWMGRNDVLLLTGLALLALLPWATEWPANILPAHIDHFAAGIIAEVFFRRRAERRLPFPPGMLVPTCVVLLALAVPRVTEGLGFPSLLGSTPMWAAVLLGAITFGTVALPRSGWSRLAGSTPLVWLGEISFGVYLLHDPMVAFWRAVMETGLSGGIAFAAALAMTIVLARIAYLLIEQPARSALRRAGRSQAGQTKMAAAPP